MASVAARCKIPAPYRGYDALVARWRGLGTPRVIGNTVDGAPLHAIEIGPADAPSASAILAGIHPIEWIGVETMLALLERLSTSPPTDRRIIAFPLINVDGYRRVEENLLAGRRAFVRGNRRGVDLNRNWPSFFVRRPKRRGLFGDYNHGGDHPCSEPEVAAIISTLDEVSHGARIDVALSLHSIGRMLLYPYGGRWQPPAAADRHRSAARAIQRRLPRRYTVRQSSHWVPGSFAHGMEIDHLHDRYGATAILVECTWGGVTLRNARRVRDALRLRDPFHLFNPPDPEREIAELVEALDPFVRGK